MANVNIEITRHAQLQIKDAINWRSRRETDCAARDSIKSTIIAWKSQLETLPESGKACQYFDSPEFREIVKGNYRFVYEIRNTGEQQFNIYLLIFCHVRMDYQDLINQFGPF
ncbi:type II toxin-antitoxin system RelE/ParE family toxin [Pseudoalteromonas sp. Of7M-16]|uniref:type II toxin-antitoxin system RelE/ParE family toxin n=1 Tax=Pseudoalteromonas sp. Of7M-16 TaxID=2917756 RepID=UPI001EF4C878|nr:type II toxin-antitoxin system RelE/ParE family toxin [Pseudoalteromonas sp. Of7M-16]MCG7550611.1 type II toxin-antitoxin system RelE/ParE family toxin [Pseudoalteromonas sp. Of7M-16]